MLSSLFSWDGFYEAPDISQFLAWVFYYDTPGACEAWISMRTAIFVGCIIIGELLSGRHIGRFYSSGVTMLYCLLFLIFACMDATDFLRSLFR